MKKFTHQFHCMTTPCELILYSDNAQTAKSVTQDIEANTRRLENKYNFFDSNSFLSSLNNRSQSRIAIDAETHSILTQVRELSEKTKQHFDITTGTLKKSTTLKSVKEVEAYRTRLAPFMGPETWHLEEDAVVFSNKQVKLDLGGVIKEYAVDQAGIIAKNNNIAALINFGGDIYVNGQKPDNSNFTVALKNPKQPQQHIAVIQLCNQGLTTSAHYERSTQVEGRSYSHIIGKQETSNTAKIISATVISDSVMGSGIYSTALMIEPTLAVDKNISVVLIDDQLRLHQNIAEASACSTYN